MKYSTTVIILKILALFLIGCKKGDVPATVQVNKPPTDPLAQNTPIITAEPTPFLQNSFSYQSQQHGDIFVELQATSDYSDVILQITRDEIIQEFSLKIIGTDLLGDVNFALIDDINLDGEAEIVLDIFTPGANCCTIFVIVYYDPRDNQYTYSNQLIRKWGLAPQIYDINQDQRPEFITRTGATVWTSTAAASLTPITIYRFDNGQIIDVTDEFPEIIEQEANVWLAAAQGNSINISEEYLQLPFAADSGQLSNHPEWKRLYLSSYLSEMATIGKFEEGWANTIALCEDEDCLAYFNRLKEIFLPYNH